MEYLRRGREYFHKNTIPEAFASLDVTYQQIETANKTHAELIIPKHAEGNTVVVAPGFADKSRLYHEVMATLAKDKRVVYCLQHARIGIPIEKYEDETDRMTVEALSLIDHARTLRPDARIDLLGTSFGSIAVGKAALQLDTKPGNKELWDNPITGKIILNSPAGLTKDTLPELVKGMTEVVAVEGAYDVKKGDFGKLGRDTVDFVQYNANFLRALKEGFDIAHTDISDLLSILGDRIYLIHTTEDFLFSIERVFAGADRASIPQDHRFILPGRHGGFIDTRFIKTVRSILMSDQRETSFSSLSNDNVPTQIFPQTDEELFANR
jgi:hypothetical protein